VSDNGNYILDLHFSKPIKDPKKAAQQLKETIGVVEHGFFIGMASVVLIAGKDSSDCEEYLEDLEDKATGGYDISIAALVLVIFVIFCGFLAAGLSYYVVIEQQKKIQHLMDRLSLVVPSWKNVSGAIITCRTEPDMEKKADKKVDVGETVFGLEEGEWLKTDDGLYLPMKHPTTGASLFTATQQPPTSEATNDSTDI